MPIQNTKKATARDGVGTAVGRRGGGGAAAGTRPKIRQGGRPEWVAFGRHERRAYLAAFLVLAAAVSLALAMSARDAARHRRLYDEYARADELLDGDDFEGAAELYARLAGEYPSSYILEMKQSVCAIGLRNYESALAHGVRAVELNPLMLLEENVRETLAFCYEKLGDQQSARMLHEYGGGGAET